MSRTRTPVRGITRPEPRDSGDMLRDLSRSVEEVAARQVTAEAQLDELGRSLAALREQLTEDKGADKVRALIWRWALGIAAALVVAAVASWLRWRPS